jgi:hypothetical protein
MINLLQIVAHQKIVFHLEKNINVIELSELQVECA